MNIFDNVIKFLKRKSGFDVVNVNDNVNDNNIDKKILQQHEFLRNCQYKTVDFWNLKGHETYCKCVKVYDGDTCTMVFFYQDKPYKFRVRLAEIDTPEIKSDNPLEKQQGLICKNRLFQLIGNDLCYIVCQGFDKYGRLLAKLYNDETKTFYYNQMLLDEGLAYEYKGGKRKDFNEWFNKNIYI